MKKYIVCFFIIILISSCPAADIEQNLKLIKLPPGFSIELYARDVPGARSMAMSDKGLLFVGTRSRGVVYALEDTNGDGFPETGYTVAEKLNMPNGVAIKDGDLYVSEVNRILRFDDIGKRYKDKPEPVVVIDTLPAESHHGWKYIAFGPDEKLYIPVGAPCNVCLQKDERFSTIMRMNPDGSELEVFAHGIRNSVGFDWHPGTNELWFTDNGRDMLGDNRPPDELNRANKKGLHFGFPYIHGADITDPKYGKGKNPGDYTLPARELGPHVAALGMKFYRGDLFPEDYRGQIFIAEHGSWNRTIPIGYRITLVILNGSRVTGYEVFAEGWLKEGQSWGRPVAVLELEDGSLLISDDKAGVIYKISYAG